MRFPSDGEPIHTMKSIWIRPETSFTAVRFSRDSFSEIPLYCRQIIVTAQQPWNMSEDQAGNLFAD